MACNQRDCAVQLSMYFFLSKSETRRHFVLILKKSIEHTFQKLLIRFFKKPLTMTTNGELTVHVTTEKRYGSTFYTQKLEKIKNPIANCARHPICVGCPIKWATVYRTGLRGVCVCVF